MSAFDIALVVWVCCLVAYVVVLIGWLLAWRRYEKTFK